MISPGLRLDHLLGNIATAALEDLERQGTPAAGELRERLRQLLEDQVEIAAMAMAGANVAAAQEALEARLLGLKAAGLVLSVGQIQRAVHGALMAALRVVFAALV